jgi:hypothetical protein
MPGRPLRSKQIQVDEDHAPARPCERDREVADRRRLALLLARARHHDGARLHLQVGEVEVDAELAVGLGLEATLVVEHAQAAGLAQRARRDRDAREQGQAEPLGDLVGAADARVERLGQGDEHQADDDAEAEAHRKVSARERAHLGGARRGLGDRVSVAEALERGVPLPLILLHCVQL